MPVSSYRKDTLMEPFVLDEEEYFGRDRGFTYDATLLLQQRNDVKVQEWKRKYRRWRHQVYDFLDHPLTMSFESTLYHFIIFFVVLFSVVVGASTVYLENKVLLIIYSTVEVALAVFFLVEFFVRMWAISADAKYMGWRGHLRYLCKLVCITDIIIICVTFAILFVDKRFISANTMDYLRFIQILRLFHIDRQMTTWRLVKNMVMMSKWELFSAYYITIILFLIMATLVYDTEHIGRTAFAGNATEQDPPSIPTLAHSLWFGMVSILTIGYGDIVPQFWISKMIVCVLGFLAYCTFVTASTQISVGMTLMMEEDSKNEYRNKLRHNAATVIQCWWRYHRATTLMNDMNKKTQHFRHVCYNLYLTNERLTKMRDYEKRIKEKREKARKLHHQKQPKSSPIHHQLLQDKWKHSLRFGVTEQAIHPTGINASHLVRKASLMHQHRYMSLPATDAMSAASSQSLIEPLTKENLENFYDTRRLSLDTTISVSFDGSDSEQSFPIGHEPRPSCDINAVDDKILHKYQPLLRFLYFLLFCQYMAKFQRLRKADKLLEMEAEIIEQIHERDQKLNELENTITQIIGRPCLSPLDNSGKKLEIVERIELCEKRMEKMEKKVDEIADITAALVDLLNGTPRPQVKSPMARLPPPPPGKKLGRRLKRQQTIDSVREFDPECE